MKLEEYILLPLAEHIVLPYETTTVILENNSKWKPLLEKHTKIVLSIYKKDTIENSIVLEEAPSNDWKMVVLSKYGTLVIIETIKELDNGKTELIVRGLGRVLILGTKVIEQHKLLCDVTLYNPVIPNDSYKVFDEIRLSICDILQSNKSTTNIYQLLSMAPVEFFYFVIKELADDNLAYKKSQLEEDNLIEGLKSILKTFFHLNKKFKENIEQEIYDTFKKNVEDHQKNYLLNEQMKTIKKEMEKFNPTDDSNLEEEIKNHSHIPPNIKKILLKEYEKIRHHNPLSSEYTVTKNYLTLSLSLPWGKYSDTGHVNLQRAEDILNRDHYALEDVKENILQYLATAFKTKQNSVKVLLLVGPPGVGKTSIGSSIAQCLNREFLFISLTSIMDIADLTGHRRTYVGAYPGQIINKLIECGVSNPVIFLDEIDKMKGNYNNPINVLVLLLDPVQNHNFTDNFLGYPFDMSKAVFVLTANTTENIPDYLLSRMEKIYIDGYTIYEKIHIAKEFLIPKLYKTLNVKKNEIAINEAVIEHIIKYYTREMGVRSLNKLLNNIISKAIYLQMKEGEKKNKKITINTKNIKEFTNNLHMDFDIGLGPSEAIGLAWTSIGGDVLKIQALFVDSPKSEVIITGNIGKVMEESAKVALTLVKQSEIIKTLKVPDNFFNVHNLHIHVPEGAVPKDGPSAGVTIYTAILMALKNKISNRSEKTPLIAMTGEISLSREVMAVGGIKQKILAARMYGIREIILPKKNKQNVEQIKNFPFEEMKIHFISYINELEAIIFASII
jgi:ATP-dependent Lon protease